MDPGGRLTGQQVTGGTATFAYDSRGNLTLKWHQGLDPMTFVHDAASRVTTLQDGPTRVTYAYDADGNTTSEDRGGVGTNWVYDQENRLTVEVAPDGSCSTYAYSADGLRRTVQTVTSSIRTMVWDGSDTLGEE